MKRNSLIMWSEIAACLTSASFSGGHDVSMALVQNLTSLMSGQESIFRQHPYQIPTSYSRALMVGQRTVKNDNHRYAAICFWLTIRNGFALQSDFE